MIKIYHKLYQEKLLSEGVDKSQIININLEDPNYHNLLDWKILFDYVQSKLLNDKKNYVFLDEIQNVEDFQRAADGLFIKSNVIYLTGANSHFQAGQWATMLAGRYIEIPYFAFIIYIFV
ncbi:MAG: AAA family ATPase [Endomicrobium sp.]|nr:AAA family ATPase [Endomicrobium sp.]